MATWTRREVTRRTVEFAVPADEPCGASWAEMQKALAAARADFQQLHGLPVDYVPGEDELRVLPRGDDEIVIRFEVKGGDDG